MTEYLPGWGDYEAAPTGPEPPVVMEDIELAMDLPDVVVFDGEHQRFNPGTEADERELAA